MNKREFEKIKKYFDTQLKELKATTGDIQYRYTVKTTIGEWYIHVSLTDEPRNKSVTVFSRFENPKQAVARGIDCNPYTGKYNFWDRTFEDLKKHFECIAQTIIIHHLDIETGKLTPIIK